MPLSIIILAAGQGTRMCSGLPKVLHPLGGKPLLHHVIGLDSDAIHVVVGHGAGKVREVFSGADVHWVEQVEQLGTGHAVAQVMPSIPDDHIVLVMYGDVPLIRAATLQPLCEVAEQGFVALLTAELEDPTGYGRILHHADGSISSIVEEKDASKSERAIPEINTGFLAANAKRLRSWVDALDNNNASGEFYLTDVTARAVADGCGVRRFQARQAAACLQAGVTLIDPARFDLRGQLQAGQDVLIDVNVVLEGEITLGNAVHVGSNVVMRNVRVGDGVEILPNCVIEDAVIGSNSRIGPFARIRPETTLAENTHVGNFVEIKKSDVGTGSKINHLSYIGDTSVGSGVNIGAGTITCNYDGANKFRTVIGDNVFIGSDTQLIAPVEIKSGATIGAGSTITRDAPANELTLSRAPQETRTGWQRPVKNRKG